ncbi:ComF family protein [Candidatus Margulisiibacteriota bacterium]
MDKKIIHHVQSLASVKVHSLCKYEEPFKHLIWLIKFRNKKVLIPFIQKFVERTFPAELIDIDYIIPVPIHKHRHNDRGFNQAEEFIKTVSERFNIPILTDCLIRQSSTKSLYAQDKNERAKTISGTIKCIHPETIKDKNILIFDDILTSGATLTECGRVLIANGTHSLFGLTICHA